MTDYSTMTIDELEAALISKGNERDVILQEQVVIQGILDQKIAEVQAQALLDSMNDAEREAMEHAIQNQP